MQPVGLANTRISLNQLCPKTSLITARMESSSVLGKLGVIVRVGYWSKMNKNMGAK